MNKEIIKEKVKILDLCKELNIKVYGNNMASCIDPSHKNHDIHPSLQIYPGNTYYCFTCGKGGDVIAFIQHYHGCNFQEAIKILRRYI